ncbi:SAM-dependent methyltransferase [Actinomycetospora atypica]|uniref:SAM-dependent methyltransferase n=1 Tax=Actinomycetospora atypica TaxID=1290095 RepID=A0ABV9YIQ0_9PSEU
MPPEEFLETGIDFERANAARMYDYMLGGAHNFEVDRAMVAAAVAANPGIVTAARANRDFLGRVVQRCVELGVDQFLDLGSGVPTAGNVHEIAQRHDPHARVAYVDFEPVAVAHATELIGGLDTVSITRADIRDPGSVLRAPGVAGLLDFSRPVALLAMTILHFVDDDAAGLLGRYRRALVPGSVVALSHASDDQDDPAVGDAMRAGAETYRSSATPITLRSRAELRALLDGLDLAEPGIVDVTDWPGPSAAPPVGGYGAFATVPG